MIVKYLHIAFIKFFITEKNCFWRYFSARTFMVILNFLKDKLGSNKNHNLITTSQLFKNIFSNPNYMCNIHMFVFLFKYRGCFIFKYRGYFVFKYRGNFVFKYGGCFVFKCRENTVGNKKKSKKRLM